MTPLEEVKAMTRDCITPAIAARVIGCDPYDITIWVRDSPGTVPFPAFRLGNRTKIPRLPFIRYFEGKEAAT